MTEIHTPGLSHILETYADSDWVPESLVRQLFGCTRQTIWRWEKDDSVKLPLAIKIRNKKYRKAGELRAFLAQKEQERQGSSSQVL